MNESNEGRNPSQLSADYDYLGSTKKDIKVEVCSKCHPFFTGKQKLVDTGGRVAKFNKKFGLDK